MGFLLFTLGDAQMLCAKLGYHRLVRLLPEENFYLFTPSENESNFCWKMFFVIRLKSLKSNENADTCPCSDI